MVGPRMHRGHCHAPGLDAPSMGAPQVRVSSVSSVSCWRAAGASPGLPTMSDLPGRRAPDDLPWGVLEGWTAGMPEATIMQRFGPCGVSCAALRATGRLGRPVSILGPPSQASSVMPGGTAGATRSRTSRLGQARWL